MARWRTLNKRARRRRKHDAELARNFNNLLAPAVEAIMKDAIKAAFAEMAKQIDQIITAWARAGERLLLGWAALDPKYACTRRSVGQWPEVVYEDVLDAECIGED